MNIKVYNATSHMWKRIELNEMKLYNRLSYVPDPTNLDQKS